MIVGAVPGKPVPSRWSLVRRELERILADGEWHSQLQLRGQLSRWVDPRMAARAWVRDYERSSRTLGYERPPASEVLRQFERQALYMGAWVVINDVLRHAIRAGRIEVRGAHSRRCFRLCTQPGEAHQAVA